MHPKEGVYDMKLQHDTHGVKYYQIVTIENSKNIYQKLQLKE